MAWRASKNFSHLSHPPFSPSLNLNDVLATSTDDCWCSPRNLRMRMEKIIIALNLQQTNNEPQRETIEKMLKENCSFQIDLVFFYCDIKLCCKLLYCAIQLLPSESICTTADNHLISRITHLFHVITHLSLNLIISI